VRTSAGKATRDSNFTRGRGLARFDKFYVLKESLTKCRHQLAAIGKLTPVQKQFIATLVDTEVAVGYFLVARRGAGRNGQPTWQSR
jgi:hypothetical protein